MAVIRRLFGTQLRFNKPVCWGEREAGGFGAQVLTSPLECL